MVAHAARVARPLETVDHAGQPVAPLDDGQALQVADARAPRDELAGRGVQVSDVQDLRGGASSSSSDPDGNRWAVQEIRAQP